MHLLTSHMYSIFYSAVRFVYLLNTCLYIQVRIKRIYHCGNMLQAFTKILNKEVNFREIVNLVKGNLKKQMPKKESKVPVDKVWMYEEIMTNDDNLESNLLTFSLLKCVLWYKLNCVCLLPSGRR